MVSNSTCGPEAGDVQHQPTTFSGLAVHGQAGQFLQSVQHIATHTDEMLEASAHDGDRRTVAVHIDVDVAVHISDVQQLLQEVGCNVSFVLQLVAHDLPPFFFFR
jgi:hypothetical protein